MILNVTSHHFEELVKKGHTLDGIFLLKLIEEKTDISELCTNSAKISNIYQGLIRKDLVSLESQITLSGKELLTFMETIEPIKLIKKGPDMSSFSAWWAVFPGTDTFTHRGKTFQGTRSLRVSKFKCESYFKKILERGKYTAEEIIAATQYDVDLKKEQSVKKGSNQLTFIQNSGTYLFKDIYEPFIELIKEGVQVVEGSTKGLEIDI